MYLFGPDTLQFKNITNYYLMRSNPNSKDNLPCFQLVYILKWALYTREFELCVILLVFFK